MDDQENAERLTEIIMSRRDFGIEDKPLLGTMVREAIRTYQTAEEQQAWVMAELAKLPTGERVVRADDEKKRAEARLYFGDEFDDFVAANPDWMETLQLPLRD